MTEFILVITELYTPNTAGFPHRVYKAAMCSGLVRPDILCILISCVRAVCAMGRFAPGKKTSPLFCSAFPMASNEAMARCFILMDRVIKYF